MHCQKLCIATNYEVLRTLAANANLIAFKEAVIVVKNSCCINVYRTSFEVVKFEHGYCKPAHFEVVGERLSTTHERSCDIATAR